MASSPITSWQIDEGKKEALTDFVFLGSKITLDGDCSHEIKMCLFFRGKLWQVRQHIKKQRHHFANKSPYTQSCGSSNSHVPMWVVDHKEGWAWNNWCLQTVVLEKALEIPLDSKAIKPGNPKGNQSWIVTGWTMLKLKLQYIGHLTQSTHSLEKTLMLGKIEGRKWRGWQRTRW